MLEHLKDVEKRFEALSNRLSLPEVVSNQKEFQKLSKEYADLRELVETYRQYRKITEEIAGAREMVQLADDPDMVSLAKAELEELEKKEEDFERDLKLLLLPKDPNDDKNVILEIRAGTGGDEAALFAADILRLYLRYAENLNWKIEVMSKSETGLGGIKEIIILIQGQGAYSQLKYESGVHRVQRIPQTETSGRVHTSAVTVAVLPEADDVDVKVEEKDLKIDVMRAGGPGGQSVNTTDSAVRVTHIPSGIVVICQDEKSQHKNKAKALKVLKSRLLEAEIAKKQEEESSFRKSMVGSGDRSERIRTYNFPQNRLTDHRIGLTSHKLDLIMEGDLEEVITALRTSFQAELLKEAAQ
ncbi:MAG TPA: peptide chain release factor 1 [Oligoflexia bacterium]|mgnify:CR=1 FL=1|nr:peptide chain release factor 1 [Oligoflexia bacterium]HMR24902.1 peptide chain release factor 1 [Oligoflexia bacterium]